MSPKKTPILMNEAPAAEAGSAAGGAPAAASSVLSAGAGAAPAAAAAPAPAAAATATPPAGDPPAWAAPDKYQVKKDDGSIDWEATARKIDEGRSHLEKRLGAGDVPPADPSGYKVAAPEQYADALKGWDPGTDQALQSFLTSAHKAGMTQAQVDLVIGEFGRVMSEVQGAQVTPEQKAQQATQALQQTWKTEAEYKAGVQGAYRAAAAFAQAAGLTMDEVEAEIGNNPTAIRLLAAIAPELQEATAPPSDASGVAGGNWKDQVATLRAEKAALPEKDPRRQTIQNQINALYEKHVR